MKKYVSRCLIVLLIFAFCMSCVVVTSSAATNYFVTNGWSYQTNSDDPHFDGPPDCIDIFMYGGSYNMVERTLENGSVINWSTVTIYLDVHGDMDYGVYFELEKDGATYLNQNVISYGNSDRVLYNGSLPDGKYKLTYLTHLTHSFLFVEWYEEYVYQFEFTVDKTKPSISGASTSTKHTRFSFTVTASDTGSGVMGLYYSTPTDSIFRKASSQSMTFAQGATKGKYSFYAIDNAGNMTDTHYVYYDDEAPTGTIQDANGSVLTDKYTGGPFKYVAADGHGGVSYAQYKLPNASSWSTYTSGTQVPKTKGDGLYQFRCTDYAGNTSAIQSITLDTTAPSVTLYADGIATSNGKTVVANNISMSASDAMSGVRGCYVKMPGASAYIPYTAGTKLTQEGTYSFYSYDMVGNANQETYTITLAHPTVYYTVTYNANGGSNAPAAQQKAKGVDLTLSSTKPNRAGYNFLGWSTAKDATSATYQAGGVYTTDASVTLYAVWQVKTYDLVYHANGGSSVPARQTKTHGVPLTLSTVCPTRTGYTFLGWASSSATTTASYQPGETFTGNYSILLYAVWEKDPEIYVIKYHANGGSGAPASQQKTENKTLYLSSTVPTKAYHTFLGWSKSASATVSDYAPGDSFTENASVTLYAVWKYAPESYAVRYFANGGSGAPSAQVKTEGIALTLSATKPVRERYTFLGWSTNDTATAAEYDPGANYTADADIDLFAVWQKNNYEFSVSNLSVVETKVYRYGMATVKVRTDSWDKVNGYEQLPVQLYYDGRLLGTQYVDFAPYGVANVTFTVNVGDTAGLHKLEVRINWDDRAEETNANNNAVTASLTVHEYDYEMTMDPVTSAGYYCEGMEVVSSFFVGNNSDFDIVPSHNNTARFTAYYYEGTRKIVMTTQDWNSVVIPTGGTNLVYFKWTVPLGLKGTRVYMECTINAEQTLREDNLSNNTASYSTVISTVSDSQTPDTRFESKAPDGYTAVSAPAQITDQATWTMWVYENGTFVLRKYGVQISSAKPTVAPGEGCSTAVYENGQWVMRSGYGITLSYQPTISTAAGCTRPDSNAYTGVQYVIATFPEYRYDDTENRCRTLVCVDGKFYFEENPHADGKEQVHFIPVYVQDGRYTVSVTATHVWTPAGMIEATRNANTIMIDGTIYDDWYQG